MKKIIFLFLIFCVIILGCNIQDIVSQDEDKKPAADSQVSINGLLSKLVVQEIASPSSSSRAIEDINGTLLITNQTSGEEEEYNWYAKLDRENLSISSNRTIILSPGLYSFDLELMIDNYQYIGSAANVTMVDGMNEVSITLVSIIGDTILNFDLYEYACLRFSYPAIELENIARPRLGLIYTQDNNEQEVYFNINKETGISETYINLEPGNYHFQLLLFDNRTQIGKSIDQEEDVVVALKQDIVMDIVPLYSETNFELLKDGGDAEFIFNIPVEIVDEAGGMDDLTGYIIVYSILNGMNEGNLLIEDTPGGYTGTITFENFHYDTVALTITFLDNSDYEIIGAAGQDDIVLNNTEQTFTLPIDVIRRSLVQGHIMGVIGITVINQSIPVEGANIYINDEFAGISGSTGGYLKVYLDMGEYTVRAEKDGLAGSEIINVSSLDIMNIEIDIQ